MPFFPVSVNLFGNVIIIYTIQEYNFSLISVIGQKIKQIFLCTPGLSKNNSFSLPTQLLNLFEALCQCRDQVIALCVCFDPRSKVSKAH